LAKMARKRSESLSGDSKSTVLSMDLAKKTKQLALVAIILLKEVKKLANKEPKGGSGQGTGKASDKKGDQYYDVEVSLEELAEYLFADLELPDLEKKQFRFITEETIKRKGYRFQGIRPRLSKKETLKRKIRRQKWLKRTEHTIQSPMRTLPISQR
jgi:uncharacterized sporulation protein YeaH/YhbH (DUF444 family)